MERPRALVALLALCGLLTACSEEPVPNATESFTTTTSSVAATTSPTTTAVTAEAARSVEVVATDFGYQLPTAKVPSGPLALTMVNRGVEIHQATVLRLPDGVRADEVAAALRGGDASALTGTTSMGGPGALRPGRKARVDLDLAPGAYLMVCFIPSPRDAQAHSQKGMASPFTVEGPAPAAVTPSTKGTITITAAGYQLPASLSSGSYRVVNESEQTADAVLLSVNTGRTSQDVAAFFAGGAAGPAPFTIIGGMANLSPTTSAIVNLEVSTGKYVLVGFATKPAGGAPELLPGLMAEVNVS